MFLQLLEENTAANFRLRLINCLDYIHMRCINDDTVSA